MAHASVSRRPGWLLVACSCAVLGVALANPALAADATTEPGAPIDIASQPEPWAATELEGAQAVSSGHGRYVAVGGTGFPSQAAAWTSTDGLTWDEATVTDPPVGSAMTDVIATEEGFVAFGVESGVYDGTAERAHAWSSADGLAWQEAQVKGAAKAGLQLIAQDVVDGPAGQLALGAFIGQDLGGQPVPRSWQTADGLNWEKAKLPKAKGRTWNGVMSVPQGYLLLGQSLLGEPYNWRSVDGVTWKRLRGTPQLYDVAVSETGALAGIGYMDIFQSPRSLRGWEKVMTRPKRWQIDGANAFSWVEWDGSEFVVPGRDVSMCLPSSDECERSPLLVSIDGTAWSEAAGPDGLPGADEGVMLTDVAALDDSTVVLGQDHGTTTVWTIGGDVTE